MMVNSSPPNRALDANLWMQISAEYRACCHQSFNLARRRVYREASALRHANRATPLSEPDGVKDF